jgi:hypothetical protein
MRSLQSYGLNVVEVLYSQVLSFHPQTFDCIDAKLMLFRGQNISNVVATQAKDHSIYNLLRWEAPNHTFLYLVIVRLLEIERVFDLLGFV